MNPSLQQRNAGIVAMFDEKMPVPQISKKYRLTRQSCYAVLAAKGRSPGINRNDASAYDTVSEFERNARWRADNQRFLKRVYTVFAKRGKMPPNMTEPQFWQKCRDLGVID